MKAKTGSAPARATRSSTRGVTKLTNATSQAKEVPAKAGLGKRRKPQVKKQFLVTALERYHTQSDADPNSTCALFRWPRELFANTINFLPEEALISLSLTCKLALQLIGTDCWIQFKKQGRRTLSRQRLMEYFKRDTPNLDVCMACITIHPPLKPPREHRESRLTKTCFSQWALVDYLPQVKSDDGPDYSLCWPHIRDAYDKGPSDIAAIEALRGIYTTSQHPRFTYTLESSAVWANKAVVLKHVHTFAPGSKTPLHASAIMDLPLRLCPHHSTTTSCSNKRFYHDRKTTTLQNRPLLIHAVNTAFPTSRRHQVRPNAFKSPTTSEQHQMDLADAGEHVMYKCRGCPTKYQVRMHQGSLVVRTWHFFGHDAWHAMQNWMRMVRRDETNLGPDKRNSEFWYRSQTIPDFAIE